jgi:flotillin
VETQAAVGEAKAQSEQEIQIAEQDALSDEGRKAAEGILDYLEV